MASYLRNMRNRRGYRGLLRGNRTMLGPVQISSLRLASFLHGIQAHWLGFILWSALILVIADCFIRDELNFIEFSWHGLEWLAIASAIVLLIMILASYNWRRILRSDPYRSAREDAEHILSEVRDSRGRRATAEHIAGPDEAEFLCDFYEVKSLHWLGILSCVVMFIGLAASCIPHVLYYQAENDEIMHEYLTTEEQISDALRSANLCDEITESDGVAVFYSHYVRCTVKFEDDTEFTMTINLSNSETIDALTFKYQINQEISEIPNIELVNDLIVVLTASLQQVDYLADGDILYYYYQIDDDFISVIEQDGYQESSNISREAIAGNDNKRVYLSYYYSEYYGADPTNYVYIYSD